MLRVVRPHRLTDAQREEAIKRAGEAVQRHMDARMEAMQEANRCKARAEEAARRMAELIQGRSSEQVQRMEAERGLS